MTLGFDKPLSEVVAAAMKRRRSQIRSSKQGPTFETRNPNFETNSNVRNRGKFETLGF